MTEFLQNLLYAVITAAIPVLTVFGVSLLSKLFTKITRETDQTIVANTVNDVLDLILKVVTSTSQTYVDSLKASGKFDEEAQKKAFQSTKDTILELLSTESKELLGILYGDINKWLTVQIEAAVAEVNLTKKINK